MKNFFIVIFVLLSFVQCKAQTPEELAAQNKEIDSTKVILPDEQHVKINQIITRLLSRYHYRRAELNDSLSQEIYDQYINVLDNNKLYFLKKDVESFEKYRNEFDTYLLTGELEPAYDIFNVFKTRLNERIKYVDNQLKSEFDFTLAETYTPDRDEAEWAKSIE
ncbi:MAG: tail-specific protease, partial [Melioribacteraceae bacterium]|nr:tail-specific protease [Melioribacteraceae bacterium]